MQAFQTSNWVFKDVNDELYQFRYNWTMNMTLPYCTAQCVLRLLGSSSEFTRRIEGAAFFRHDSRGFVKSRVFRLMRFLAFDNLKLISPFFSVFFF